MTTKGVNTMISSTSFKDGMKKGIPIVTGYLPIAIAYGVIGTQANLSPLILVAMSVLVYAGAAQFMAVNLFSLGIGPWEMILTVGMLNLRHFVMGLSFQHKIRSSQKDRLVLSLGLTDETFALLSADEAPNPAYAKGVMLISYLSWVLGTVIGIFFGEVLPEVVSSGMAIAIYTLFITLLLSALQGRARLLFIPLSSMAANTLLSLFLDKGLAMLFAILLGAFIGALWGGESLD